MEKEQIKQIRDMIENLQSYDRYGFYMLKKEFVVESSENFDDAYYVIHHVIATTPNRIITRDSDDYDCLRYISWDKAIEYNLFVSEMDSFHNETVFDCIDMDTMSHKELNIKVIN